MNGFQVNQNQINEGILRPLEINQVSFDGYNLSDCDIIASLNGNEFDLADVQTNTYLAPRSDGGGIISHNITTRTISFNLLIQEETKELYQKKLDEIKESLTTTEGELILFMSGEFRVCKASIQTFQEQESLRDTDNKGEFRVEFLAVEDFKSYYPVTQSDTVSANFTLNINNQGSKATYPNLIIVFDTANLTEIRVKHNGYTYTIQENISNGDVLFLSGYDDDIDRQQNTYLNGVNLANTIGRFPYIEKGLSNPLQFEFDGTFSGTITSVYQKTYY